MTDDKMKLVQPSLEDLLTTPGARAVFEAKSAALEAAELIRGFRRRAVAADGTIGISQDELARRIGTSQARVSEIEKGEGRDGPSYALLRRIAYACGIDWAVMVRSITGAASFEPVEVTAASPHQPATQKAAIGATGIVHGAGTGGANPSGQLAKEIRTITGLGLKEAKDLVEGAPKTVSEHPADGTPESAGWTKHSLVLGKHSGRAAFRDKLNTLGYRIGDNQMNDAFRRFKDLAGRKQVVFDEDIVALVDDGAMCDHERIRFVSLDLHAGSRLPPRAEVELEVDGVAMSATATGDGAVDATFRAIEQIFPHTANLVLFLVNAVTEGTDAQARTTVRLEENGKLVEGQGTDTDTIVASAHAYVHALNKLLVKDTSTAPAVLSA